MTPAHSYRVAVTLTDVPVAVGGFVFAHLNELDCEMLLDAKADLVGIRLENFYCSAKFVDLDADSCPVHVWAAAKFHYAENADAIRERAGVHVAPAEDPITFWRSL